jgi:hypothetical protein
MEKLTSKFEAWLTGVIWVAATVLLPMAALAPVDGGRAHARIEMAAAACLDGAVDILRACPATSL